MIVDLCANICNISVRDYLNNIKHYGFKKLKIMNQLINIEITIPVLNEEKTLRKNIEKIINFFNESYPGLENTNLIIVDNGSTDATGDIGLVLQGEHKNVHYMRVKDRGVGLALKSSWENSKADIVGYMDLDLATDLRHLPQAISALRIEGYDIATGSRLLPTSEVINRKLSRSFISRVFNIILRTYFSTNFSDGMCGFKFLRKDIYQDLFQSGAQSDGWFFATEILIVGEIRGYKVKDIPVFWVDDADSKVKISKLIIEYIKAMRRLKKILSTTLVS